MTPISKGNPPPDARRGLRFTFARLHRDTATLEPATRAEVFDSLPVPFQRQAWASLRAAIEAGQHAVRSEVLAE